RGRDIKRYGYEWADLWLIATFPSCHYDIKAYPAVNNYLLSFAKQQLLDAGYDWVVENYLADYCKQKLSQTGQFVLINGKRITLGSTPEKARKRTTNKWFETQDSISYWDDFNKPKVLWKIIGCNINFCFDEKKMVCNNAVDIMTGNPNYLIQFVGLMNSKLFDWYLKLTTEAEVQGGGIQLYVTTLEKALLKLDFPMELTNAIYRRIYGEITDDKVDQCIFAAYKLTTEEQTYILNDRRVNRK
ncbi:MAG: TaqI-like C-terminal specificity domain-containing protein, partial [Bacilli bacterium]|nr:TaqI-like C-terminal specificity domain-containing protein [Bacilli bacterium]